MHRFFTSQPDLNSNSVITISDPNEIHHLKDVLRRKAGDTVTVFNNNGEEASGEIIALGKNSVGVKILSYKKNASPVTKITLACAIPKKAKFEFIIEKVTELGVGEIIPLLTERTEVRLTPEKARQKSERYQKVAINAAKQCRRSDVPTIQAPALLANVLKKHAAHSRILIPCLTGKREGILTVLRTLKPQDNILILIGPEGDFTDPEVELARQSGAIPVSLGETVLKVDTAAVSVVAAIHFILEKSV